MNSAEQHIKHYIYTSTLASIETRGLEAELLGRTSEN